VFSSATRPYFAHLPDLPGLSERAARRVLSTAYADVLAARDGFNREAGPMPEEVLAFLRRLAAALEAHAVFSTKASAEARQGAAFIAAESLSLTTRPVEAEGGDGAYGLMDPTVFERVEVALLYVIAGLEANARLTLEGIEENRVALDGYEAEAGEAALDAITGFVRLAPQAGLQAGDAADEEAPISVRVRTEAFRRIHQAASVHLAWITGRGEALERDAVLARLADSISLLADAQAARYADVLHVSRLLEAAIVGTEARALLRIPHPDDARYEKYLVARAQSRPLIWPSGTEYVAECLPGPSGHAAVALPTGSGKSFIAELAASQA
jgi:hypothetical protein